MSAIILTAKGARGMRGSAKRKITTEKDNVKIAELLNGRG